MRPFLIYSIIIAILILTHILRINKPNKYNPKQVVAIDPFVLTKVSSGCWYVAEQLLFQLPRCSEYQLGSELRVIGRVGVPIDNAPLSPNMLDVSDVQLKIDPQTLPIIHPKYIQSKIFQIRSQIGVKLARVLPQEEALLLFSLVFGGLSSLSQEQKANIQILGVQYLLAASGMQVSLILQLFSPLKHRVSRQLYQGISVVILSLYGWLALLSPSVLRAIGQKLLKQSGTFLKRPAGVPWVMLLLTITLIWLFPPDRWLSIQLSVLAVIGLQFRQIIQFSSTTPSRISTGRLGSINKIYLYIKEMLITSLCIQIWLFPWLEYYFGGVQFFSLVSAVVIVWLLPALFLFAVPLLPVLLIIPTALLRSTIVALLFWPIHAHLFLLNWLLGATSNVVLPTVTATISLQKIVVWYAILLAVFAALYHRRKRQLQRSYLEIIRKKY